MWGADGIFKGIRKQSHTNLELPPRGCDLHRRARGFGEGGTMVGRCGWYLRVIDGWALDGGENVCRGAECRMAFLSAAGPPGLDGAREVRRRETALLLPRELRAKKGVERTARQDGVGPSIG